MAIPHIDTVLHAYVILSSCFVFFVFFCVFAFLFLVAMCLKFGFSLIELRTCYLEDEYNFFDNVFSVSV
jgi:hypothetical protein